MNTNVNEIATVSKILPLLVLLEMGFDESRESKTRLILLELAKGIIDIDVEFSKWDTDVLDEEVRRLHSENL